MIRIAVNLEPELEQGGVGGYLPSTQPTRFKPQHLCWSPEHGQG